MDLFSMGVFDDERTAREKTPARPVRCLEDELAPQAFKFRKCERCHEGRALKQKTVCLTCYRELRPRPYRTPAAAESRRFVRLRTAMICHGGVLAMTKANAATLADFVDAGNARWANRRDLHRLGLPDDGPRVAILIGLPK